MKERLYDIPTRDQALDAVKQIVADCWIEADRYDTSDGTWLLAFLNDGYDRPLMDGH